MRTAAKVAAHKELHPELYCPTKKCLWRTGDGTYCPRHKPKVLEEKIPVPAEIEGSHSPAVEGGVTNETCASDLDGAKSPIE